MTRILPSIYNNIAQTARLQNDSTGIKYALEQHKLALKSKNKHDEYLALLNLGWFHHLMGNDKDALNCIYEARDLLRSNGFSNHGDLDRLYVEILIDQGNLIEAENALDSTIERVKKENSANDPETLILKADLLYRKKNYNNSIEILQQLSETPEAKPFLTRIYSLMEQNYLALGDLKKANACLHSYIDNLSILHASERDLLANERKMLLDIVEKENQIELDAIVIRNRDRLIVAMIIIILLAVLTIAGGFYYHRRQQKLFRKIVAQYSEALQREHNLEEMVTKYRSMSEEISHSESEAPKESGIDETTSDAIYEKLCRCVEEERLYADPKFTREELIEKIGTNRTYLSKIIKDKTGGNYSQFMNHFRVREAVKLLSDLNTGERTLKEIYREIGFISKSSFYKVFKETVGMTPSQFREQYKKMVQEKGSDPGLEIA